MRIKTMTVIDWKSFAEATMELTQINVLVGRNNSGKSALLRAAQFLQNGGPNVPAGDIRLGAPNARINYTIENYDAALYSKELFATHQLTGPDGSQIIPEVTVEVSITQSSERAWASTASVLHGPDNQWSGQPQTAPAEPNNYIYPYLSKRKVPSYDRTVDRQRASQVTGNLQQLPAKVARLGSPGQPGGVQFFQLVNRLLGLNLGAIPVDNGQLVGFNVGKLGTITIESMGEGVAGILGLITDLCAAENNLFLIEEPENDIHPQGLKDLLDVIIEKSETNQFIVSTHSNIVVKYLASAAHSRLFNVTQSVNETGVPTSTVNAIETSEARGTVLRNLGYDLHDFDLAEGWIIFEESSAERIIRDYLIPWFAPKLTRVRTIGAGGTGDVAPTFKEFAKLVLFIHREEVLKHRAWVIVDGDQSGQDVVEKLKKKYEAWPTDRFRCFTKERFEDYYPSRFQEKIDTAFSIPKGVEQQEAKSALRQVVQEWCDANRDIAQTEFAESAAEVISVLQEIEAELFPPR
ncbi:ATP-dependent endonuclease [Streptomyces sp. NPDC007901]|uniref:ATP-dependent nuclease n=1 Tax=Streptomyces sp. NPDC007901 TaxID=3364785 RepID=UPI0036F0E061